MELTYHAAARMKERLNVKSAKRMRSIAKKAYVDGIRETDCDNPTKKIFAQLSKNSNYDNVEARIYQDRAFIFNKHGNLVTVCPIPKDYRKTMENRRAKAHRDADFRKKKGFIDNYNYSYIM